MLTYIAWLRLPEVTRGTLWAEDGAVFLQDTVAIGPWASIGEPYAGYLHTIPRLISGIAYLVAPLSSYAIMMSFLSCAAVAAVAVGVYHLSAALVDNRAIRLMLGMIPVLLPVGPLEVLGNAANLHWYLLWLVPWLLIYEPSRWYGKGGLFVMTFAAATTEIISGLFIPLALWTAFRRRNYWAPVGLLAGMVCQFVATAAKPRYGSPPEVDQADPLSVFYGFGLQAVASLWETDKRSMASTIVNYGAFPVLIPAAVIAGLLIYVLVVGSTKWRFVAAYSFGAAALCWTAAVVLNVSAELDFAGFTEEDWLEQFTYFRYAAAPSMFLLILVPAAVAVAAERAGSTKARTFLWAPAVLLVFLSVNYFPALPGRETGPEWEKFLAVAHEECVLNGGVGVIGVALAPAPWQATLPCSVVLNR
ncbi:hypothetical protein DBR22_16970 [Arthrobacter sp. HMWF013]|nr:hypothetical protein DBR22_16970 [Arthrobacter sp. HMWF013]